MFSFELSFRAIPIINPVTDHTFPTTRKTFVRRRPCPVTLFFLYSLSLPLESFINVIRPPIANWISDQRNSFLPVHRGYRRQFFYITLAVFRLL